MCFPKEMFVFNHYLYHMCNVTQPSSILSQTYRQRITNLKEQEIKKTSHEVNKEQNVLNMKEQVQEHTKDCLRAKISAACIIQHRPR